MHPQDAKTNSPNTFISFIFDGNCYQYLSCRPTTSFPWFRSANKRFVYFNHARQTVTPRTHHGTPQFIQPCPSRTITAQTKYAFETKRTGPIFLPGYPPYRPKPNRQGFVSVLKNRPGDNRQLVMATRALVQHRTNRPCLLTAASRTDEAVWPPEAIKIVSASLLRGKPSLKFGQTLG